MHRFLVMILLAAIGLVAEVNDLLERDIPAFNKILFDNGIGKLDAGRSVQ